MNWSKAFAAGLVLLAVSVAAFAVLNGATSEPVHIDTRELTDQAAAPTETLETGRQGASERAASVAAPPTGVTVVAQCENLEPVRASIRVATTAIEPHWTVSRSPNNRLRQKVLASVMDSETLYLARTDDAGVAHLGRPEIPDGHEQIAVWIHKAGYTSALRWLNSGDIAIGATIRVVLRRAPACLVTVRGTKLAPQVHQSACFFDWTSKEHDEPEQLARPSARSTVNLAPGEATRLSHWRGDHLVVATAGELVSRPYIGPATGDIDLDVYPSFRVFGTVTFYDEGPFDAVARIQGREANGQWEDIAYTMVSDGGELEEISCPLVPKHIEWRVVVCARNTAPLLATFAASAGQRHRVHTEAPRYQSKFFIKIVDAIKGEPVDGAICRVSWDGMPDQSYEEAAGPDGYIAVEALPADSSWSVTVEAAGFVSTTLRGHSSVSWNAEGRTYTCAVYPHGVCTGRISPFLSGPDFLRCIVHRIEGNDWRSDSQPLQLDDGAFKLTNPGASRFELFMFNERGHVGPVDIDVGAPSGDIGTLAFHPWAGAEVRVIDAVTRAAIPDARVMARPSGMGWQVDALDEAVSTDSTGRAQLPFPSVGGFLQIEAPGYSDVSATEFEWQAGTAAFGTIELERTALLDVRLTGAYEQPSWWQLDTDFESGAMPTRFDETASARIDVDRGIWSVGLLDPTGREERLEFFDPIRDDLRTVEWPVAAGTIDIDFVGATAEQLEARQMHTLELDWESEQGFHSRRLKVALHLDLPDIRAISMDGVVDGAVDWTLKDPERRELAWGRAAFPLDGPQKLVVDLTHGAATLEVVDRDGAPVEGALVLAFDERVVTEGGYIRQLTTDVDGRQRLPLLEDDALGVVIIGPGGEVVPRVDAGGLTPGAIERVVLDGSGSVRARVEVLADSEDAPTLPADLRATVYRDDKALWLVECEPEGDGAHGYAGLSAADYLLQVRADGHWTRTLPFTVADATPVELTVTLPQLARIALNVVDEDGVAVAGLSLQLVHTLLDESVASWIGEGRVTGSTTLDATGRLELNDVPAGTYRVLVDGTEIGTLDTGVANTTLVHTR